MDTLFIGDIPSDYHYATFSNGYITLFNKSHGQNETLNYYRIYTNNNGFYYSTGSQSFSAYNPTYFQEINVSNDWIYRSDIDKIFTVSFFCIFLFIWVFNIVTSVFRKGGVLGGLI